MSQANRFDVTIIGSRSDAVRSPTAWHLQASAYRCSSAAVNPALTIMANALCVGDHLLGGLQ